jgi:UDP-perosamine 4-acetyltransferase
MLLIIGAGGHAKVVIAALRSAGAAPDACLDSNRALWGGRIEGVRIEGGDELLARYPAGSTALALGMGIPRLGGGRRALFESLRARGYAFPPVRADSALVAVSAALGAGAQVLTRAVVHPGAAVGEGAIVNTCAVVEHDAAVGAHAHVAPGALVLGGATVGAGAFVGAGAIVLPGIKIGRDALIAAGAVARADVPDRGRVLPFRPAGP